MRYIKITAYLICYCLLIQTATAQDPTLGLISSTEDVTDGYTLLTPLDYPKVSLIDNCGYEVHAWEENLGIISSSTYLREDGSIIRAERINSDVFFGGGSTGRLSIYDWDSNLIWRHDFSNDTLHIHHDFEVMPNGNVLLIAWDYHTAADAIARGRSPFSIGDSFWPDKIIEIEIMPNDTFNVIWEWRAWDHLIQDADPNLLNYGVVADHPELIDINYLDVPNVQDWNHCNGIDYNPELDQIILSSRYFHELWVIDHSTTTEEAAGHTGGNSGMGGDLLYRWGNPMTYKRGVLEDRKLFGPHDARWIPTGYPDEGKILIYNNGPGRPEGPYSSLDILNPPLESDGNYTIEASVPFAPVTPDIAFTTEEPTDMFSNIVSGGFPLPNGHFIACEGKDGVLREFDENGEVVWEYINPVSLNGPLYQGSQPSNNSIFLTEKYPLDYPAFLDKDLTPIAPLELMPFDNDCVATTSSSDIIPYSFGVYPSPFQDYIIIESSNENEHWLVVDVLGKTKSFTTSSEREIINTSNWNRGIHFLYHPSTGYSIQIIKP